MGDFVAKARTNYFKVKRDKLEEFTRWARALRLEVCSNKGRVCLLSHNPNGWPGYDPLDDEEESISWQHQMQPWLAKGEVVIIVESGHEGAAYVGGRAAAIGWDGRFVELDLVTDIGNLARKKWPKAKITAPSA